MTGRNRGEEDLDETLEETFPASDAPANTVETGIRVLATADASDVIDNREKARFEVTIDGQMAVLDYERTPHSLVLVNTEVPPSMRGRHVADVLAQAAIDRARAEGLQIVAVCPFVKAYLRKHPGSEVRHG